MELLDNLGLGFATALSPWNLLYAFIGCLLGHRRRRAAGPGTAGDHRHAPAADLLAAAGLGPDHALGHLLRRAVWRLDHRDPDQPARGILLGGDRDRRLPDGQERPGGPGAGDRRAGLVLRRLGRDRDPGAVRAAARQRGARVRPGRVFLAHGAGPGGLGGPGLGLAAQGVHHDRARPAARPGRHRRRDRHAALHLRSAGDRRRAQFRGAGHGRVRAGRDHPQSRARAHAQRDGQKRQRAVAVQGRFPAA